MRVLLDTNQVLFIVQAPSRVTDRTRDLLRHSTTAIVLSSVSLWEIDLKNRARNTSGDSRLPLALPIGGIVEYFLRKGARLLPLEVRHVTEALEVAPPHRDPFDWMHLKQAQSEGLKLLSSDAALADHPLVIQA